MRIFLSILLSPYTLIACVSVFVPHALRPSFFLRSPLNPFSFKIPTFNRFIPLLSFLFSSQCMSYFFTPSAFNFAMRPFLLLLKRDSVFRRHCIFLFNLINLHVLLVLFPCWTCFSAFWRR